MGARSRLRVTFALATAAHAAWLALAGSGVDPRAAAQRYGEETPVATEVDVEVATPPSVAPRLADTATDERAENPVPPQGDGRAFSAATAPGASPGASGARGALEAPPVPSSEPADKGTWAFSARADGALGGSALSGAPDAGVGMRDVLAQGDKAPTPGKGVLPQLTPRDSELGLVPGGQFVSMARDRVRRGLTPSVSHGVFEFRTDAGGVVVSVRCLDASSGRREWDEVATQLEADARTAERVRVPEGAHGVVVVVDVTSSIKSVSGRTPTDSPVAKALRAVTDPVDAVIDSQVPPQHVVAAHISDVHTF